jgi:hypothetical protein
MNPDDYMMDVVCPVCRAEYRTSDDHWLCIFCHRGLIKDEPQLRMNRAWDAYLGALKETLQKHFTQPCV